MSQAMPTRTDVLVIGAGPGGYTAAIRAAQLDLEVTLVERDAYGGTCLNHGCIPSKALLSATDLAHRTREANHMGIHATLSVDLEEVLEWKDGLVDRLTSGVEKLCKGNGVTLVEGTATFVDDHAARVELADEAADSATIDFERAIVATGSCPLEIPEFDFASDYILSSRDALSRESIPDRLLVVGAGYIGMELATAFAKAGVSVTIVEMREQPLPRYGAETTRVIRRRAEDLGIEFRFGEVAADWEQRGDEIAVTTAAEDGTTTEFVADRALVAVGREPVTDTIAFENAGIASDDDGFIATDEDGRTNREHVFAVGDVAGQPMLAHKGIHEGERAAEAIAGVEHASGTPAVPAAVFTDPEIAKVGLSEAEAAAAGFEPIVGEMRLRASGRALTIDDTDGFVTIVAGEDGRVLGARIVAPEASELIGEIGVAIESETTVAELAATVHTHPTLSEAIREAAANATGRAIHTLNR